MSTDADLRRGIIAAIWRAADHLPWILSTTIAGSFATGDGLDGISDIDTIVVADDLDGQRFVEAQQVFGAELAPVLAAAGWALRLNPTLGPLKFNDERTAVLHLMLYSAEGHREHVVKSPFTCLDWQRSSLVRGRTLEGVYPVFGLQPRHFFSGRRSAADYLKDLRDGQVSYRELRFDGGYREERRGKPMEDRDRHEFAYHILRFLMQNLLKLVRRDNATSEGDALVAAYFLVFPQGVDQFVPLFHDLAKRKHERRFAPPVSDLVECTTAFATAFEQQFRQEFEAGAVRHLLVRHGPTARNAPIGEDTIFQGRIDELALPIDPVAAHDAVAGFTPELAIASPLSRAHATARALVDQCAPGLAIASDPRLSEISYGACEGLTVAEARVAHPGLFAAWSRGEDPPFPGGGESTAMVAARIDGFLADLEHAPGSVLAISHQVILRGVVGRLLGVPQQMWHRLRIPHLKPIPVVATRRFGLRLDLSEEVERYIFAGFLDRSPRQDRSA